MLRIAGSTRSAACSVRKVEIVDDHFSPISTRPSMGARGRAAFWRGEGGGEEGEREGGRGGGGGGRRLGAGVFFPFFFFFSLEAEGAGGTEAAGPGGEMAELICAHRTCAFAAAPVFGLTAGIMFEQRRGRRRRMSPGLDQYHGFSSITSPARGVDGHRRPCGIASSRRADNSETSPGLWRACGQFTEG